MLIRCSPEAEVIRSQSPRHSPACPAFCPSAQKKRLRDFKVALVLDDVNAEVDRSVQDRLQALADFLASNKAKVNERARPDFDTATITSPLPSSAADAACMYRSPYAMVGMPKRKNL